MTIPEIEAVPPFYRSYVDQVKHLALADALRQTDLELQAQVKEIAEENGNHRYAPGKWSIREVLQHVLDAERIFAYRALRFSRNDQTPLPPFDENAYVPEANAGSRTLAGLAGELSRLRVTTIDLFAGFTEQMLDRTGTASGKKISVRALGYIIAGHEAHHNQILRERYLTR